jgi:hypothetical protein
MGDCAMVGRLAVLAGVALWATIFASRETTSAKADPHVTPAGLFVAADTCKACHTNLVTPSGEDVSIFTDWRSSMMANSARDPYWMAAVRREVMDHPTAAIQ